MHKTVRLFLFTVGVLLLADPAALAQKHSVGVGAGIVVTSGKGWPFFPAVPHLGPAPWPTVDFRIRLGERGAVDFNASGWKASKSGTFVDEPFEFSDEVSERDITVGSDLLFLMPADVWTFSLGLGVNAHFLNGSDKHQERGQPPQVRDDSGTRIAVSYSLGLERKVTKIVSVFVSARFDESYRDNQAFESCAGTTCVIVMPSGTTSRRWSTIAGGLRFGLR